MTWGLGAKELIELGDAGTSESSSTFLSSRREQRLGLSEDLGEYLSDVLEKDLSLMAKIAGAPVAALGRSRGATAVRLTTALREVPALGALTAQALLVSDAVRRAGLTLPGAATQNVQRVADGIHHAMNAAYGSSEQEEFFQLAREAIVEEAPSAIQGKISSLLGNPLRALST